MEPIIETYPSDDTTRKKSWRSIIILAVLAISLGGAYLLVGHRFSNVPVEPVVSTVPLQKMTAGVGLNAGLDSCLKMENDSEKKECLQKEQDISNRNNAFRQFNEDICEQIENDDIENDCHIRLRAEEVKLSSDAVGAEELQRALYTYKTYGQWDKCVSLGKIMDEKKFHNAESQAYWALCYAVAGSMKADLVKEDYYTQSEKILNVLLANDPKDALAMRVEARLLELENKKEEALKLFNQALEVKPNDFTFLLYRGEFYARNNRLAEAKADFLVPVEKRRAMGGESELLIPESKLCRLAQYGGETTLGEYCQAILNSSSKKIFSASQAIAFRYEAKELQQEKKYPEALVYLKEAQSLDFVDPDSHIDLAQYYIETQDFLQAEKSARQALTLSGDTASAGHLVLARTLFGQNQLEKSIDEAQIALKLVVADSNLWSNEKKYYQKQVYQFLGEAYAKSGEQEKSRQYFELGAKL